MPGNDAAGGGSPVPALTTIAVPPAVEASTAAAGHIARMWRENRAGNLLHVVFYDPVPDDGPDPHGKLRDQLAGFGVPRSAIRIAREAGPRGEAQLVADCRSGAVSVLVTSSARDRFVRLAARGRQLAVHHVDVPRSYHAAQQRAQAVSADPGRMIFRYVPSGIPGTGWETHDQKTAFTDQLLAGPAGGPAIEIPGDAPVSYNDVKAAALGFPEPNLFGNGNPERPGTRRSKRAGNADRPGRSRHLNGG